MNSKHSKEVDALDLLIEDISTIHPSIRKEAKKMQCEEELNSYAEDILEYIKQRRNDVLNKI